MKHSTISLQQMITVIKNNGSINGDFREPDDDVEDEAYNDHNIERSDDSNESDNDGEFDQSDTSEYDYDSNMSDESDNEDESDTSDNCNDEYEFNHVYEEHYDDHNSKGSPNVYKD